MTHTYTHAHTHTHSVNKWSSASYKIPSKSTDKRDLGENRAIMLIFVASWKNHSGNKETGCQLPEKHQLPLNWTRPTLQADKSTCSTAITLAVFIGSYLKHQNWEKQLLDSSWNPSTPLFPLPHLILVIISVKKVGCYFYILLQVNLLLRWHLFYKH